MQKFFFKPSVAMLATVACLAWGGAVQAQPSDTLPSEGISITQTTDVRKADKRGTRQMYRDGRQMYREGHQMYRDGRQMYHEGHHTRRGAPYGHYEGMRSDNMVMFIPGYGGVGQYVVDQLVLSDNQRQLLEQAQESTAKVELTWSRKPQKSLGKIDPHAMIGEREQRLEERAGARDESTKDWLALWDALDERQQAFLSGVFAERASRYVQRDHRRGTMRHGHRQHHWSR